MREASRSSEGALEATAEAMCELILVGLIPTMRTSRFSDMRMQLDTVSSRGMANTCILVLYLIWSEKAHATSVAVVLSLNSGCEVMIPEF
jgi:hypothetical protein